MKNKILISLLIVSFFNYIGCESIYLTHTTISQEEINSGRPNPDDEIRLILKDSTEIDFGHPVTHINNDGFYLNLDKPDSLLIGNGDIINLNTKVKKNYHGIVEGKMIDSTKIFTIEAEQFSVYWLQDQTRLSFKEGNFAQIFPGDGTGYFVLEPPKPLKKIPFDQVQEIQISKINWYLTGPLIAVYVAATIGLIILGSNLPTGSMDLSGM